MIRRFINDGFATSYTKTIGTDFLEKRVHIQRLSRDVTFFLWDTAGQEEYKALTRSYYRGCGAAIVAFSLTDYDSFLSVAEWVMTVREECGMIPILLVETKQDLKAESTAVYPGEAEKLADSLGLKLFRVSSNSGYNVKEVFEQLAVEYMKRRQLIGTQIDIPVQNVVDIAKDKSSIAVRPRTAPDKKTYPNRSVSTCTIAYFPILLPFSLQPF
jgi:Ras-related protein Rab-23